MLCFKESKKNMNYTINQFKQETVPDHMTEISGMDGTKNAIIVLKKTSPSEWKSHL